MAITIELPPTMEKEALGYSLLEGSTLERLLLDCLKREFDRRRAECQGRVATVRDFSLDPALKAEISDDDLFADDSNLWNACNEECALA